MVEWLNDTMLLEVDTMTEDDVKAVSYTHLIRKKLGSRPGSNTYILNELGVGYRMIEEDAKPLEPAEETK